MTNKCVVCGQMGKPRDCLPFHRNFSAEVSQTVKNVLTKWENKEVGLSLGCAQQLYQVLQNLISFDDGSWALKMANEIFTKCGQDMDVYINIAHLGAGKDDLVADATGKIPYGLAEGNVVEMGSFDECLKIKSEKYNITGKYCSVTVDISDFDSLSKDQSETEVFTTYKRLTKVRGADLGGQPVASIPLFGICLPDKCSADDVNNGLQLLATYIPLDIRCQTKEEVIPPLDTGAIVTLGVFGVVIALMLCSTIIDYTCQAKGIKAHPILISFSAYTNGQNLFKMRSGQGELSCLHGIRFLSMCWVILGHTFIANVLGPTVNLFEMLGYLGKTDSMLYLNCAHAVDTFFVISGLLVSYNFMKKMKKGEKFNIFNYYVHRYLRLTPAYAAVILCSIYLLKYMGSGPLYYKIDTVVSQLCRDHWWKSLLYLQNYLADAADICVSQSWNLNIDYQLYIISPLLLFFLYKTPRFGTFMTLVPIIGCMVAGFIITYQEKLSIMLVQGDTTKFMHYYYLKTHTRAATWFIGAWLGYVLGRIKFYNARTYLRIPKVLVLLIWLVVLALIPVCVFGFHNLVSGEYDVMGSSLYNTFVRPIWALCVAWIIFACSIGYGGIINDFLSLPIFGLLSKFTYSVYLVHLTILYMIVCSRKIPSYFSVAGLMSQFCSLFAISFVVAIFWILAFEMPILVIEPYIFGKSGKPSKRNQQVTNNIPPNYEDITGKYKNELHLKVEQRLTPDGQIIEIYPKY